MSTGLEAKAKVHQDEFLHCLLCREQISIGTGRQVRKHTLSKGKRTVTWPKRTVIKINRLKAVSNLTEFQVIKNGRYKEKTKQKISSQEHWSICLILPVMNLFSDSLRALEEDGGVSQW